MQIILKNLFVLIVCAYFEAGIAAEMNSYRSLLFDEDDSVAESFEQMDSK